MIPKEAQDTDLASSLMFNKLIKIFLIHGNSAEGHFPSQRHVAKVSLEKGSKSGEISTRCPARTP